MTARDRGPSSGAQTIRRWCTGVLSYRLAEELTREEVLQAYTQRRFYATEDQGLLLDDRVESFPWARS